MGKIKNWSKTGKYSYRNDVNNDYLQIGYNNPSDIIIFVEVNGEKAVKIHSGTFFNEKDARDQAIDFMRRYPLGLKPGELRV